MCVRTTPGIRHVSKKGTRMTTAVRYAEEFASSPRYKAIEAIFKAIDKLEDDALLLELSALMGRTLQSLNGEERYKLPDLVRQALKERGHTRRF